MQRQRGVRVGYFTGSAKPQSGGAWTFVDGLVQAIGALDSPHTFIHMEGLSADDKAMVRATKPPSPSPRRRMGDRLKQLLSKTARRSARIARAIHALDIDIVWYLDSRARPVPVPFIMTVWDLEHRTRPQFPEVSVSGWTWTAREKWYSTILPQASYVLTGTTAGKHQIIDYYGLHPSNIRVAPFFAPPAEAGAAVPGDALEGLTPGKFIFYPAQFWPHKNHVNLLLAIDMLKREHGLKLDVVFTGKDAGNADHVRDTINSLGLADQVRSLGFVSRDTIVWLYRNAATLAFPSFFGPDNFPPLEAFAFGCPVVAAHVAGAEEQLGEAALLFEPGKPEEIAEAIRTVCTNDGVRSSLVEAGAKIASQRTAANYMQQVCELLDEFEGIRRCWGRTYEDA